MDDRTLSELLEEDKEQLMENISRDRTPPAAQAAVEKELDRLLYRYSESAGSETLTAGAQTALQTARQSLGLMGAVSEVRQWQRSGATTAKGRKLRPLGLILAAAGLLLVLGALLVLLRQSGSVLTLSALLPPLLGSACLLLGGVSLFPGKKEAKGAEPETRQEFLVDAAGVYHTLRGTLLVADRNLRELRETEKLLSSQKAAQEGGLSGEETELFASLLETAYARRDMDSEAEELIGSIRYYLHRKNVEVIDYTKEKEHWFELLPARRDRTMRPALAFDGRLIKKGLASAGEG